MSRQIKIQYIQTKIGEIVLGSYEDELCLLDYRYRKMRARIDQRLCEGLNAVLVEDETEIIHIAQRQLNEYLRDDRVAFDLPIKTVGTEFQKQVWNVLIAIPYGETCSYSELALKLGNEKAVRAVANANGANAIAIIIPCHRVIGHDGTLGGYAGGLPVKKRLLEIEQKRREDLLK